MSNAFDVIVVGPGARGMTSAVTAAQAGLKVLALEKADVIGGTSALSGGVAWIPCNPLMQASATPDKRENAELYIREITGDRFRKDMVATYLDNGPRMVEFLLAKTAVRFQTIAFCDYKPELDGAVSMGRSIGATTFDGRLLGKDIRLLRKPLDFTTVFGGMMLKFMDIYHMLNALKTRASAIHAAKLLINFLFERLRYGRPMRLALGNALMGMLLRSAIDNKVEIWTRSPGKSLIREGKRVVGIVAERDGRPVEVRARLGIVLGSGGFANDPELRAKHLSYPAQMKTMSVAESTGDAMRMGLSAGAAVSDDVFNKALGFPISTHKHPDGRVENYMHVGSMGRNKPGTICVGPNAKRFVNEAAPYNDFGQALIDAEAVPAWWIFDDAHFRRYGAGLLTPPVWLHSIQPYLDSGYLTRAASLDELAKKINLPADQLRLTVDRWNDQSRRGVDEDFGKGNSLYDRSSGEPTNKPHPNLGPLEKAPFYAIRVDPGNLGTWVGLKTNTTANVVNEEGEPIEGLYACGLDSYHVFSGNYPGGGSSIGPSMVFGYIAAQQMLAHSRANSSPRSI